MNRNHNYRNDNYSNATKYPNIYTCYWGNFSCKDNKPSQDIISNRNRFVEDFKVQKYIDLPLKNIINCFDHKELYLIKDDRENYHYVLLNSPYHIEPSFKKKMEDNGWIKLYNMYSYSADTYYKIIKKTSARKYKSITKKDTTKLIENLFDDIHY